MYNCKLRNKKVTFMPKIEYIEPGYEDYECNTQPFKKRKPKKKTQKKKRKHYYKNRSLKK